ncbi:MAG: hypothetical protein IAF08_14975 [Rhizobacter sp.]|nr:hypothetical protein [Chlorobiales bacterium]
MNNILHGHFDGKHIRIDEPFELMPNTKVLITVLPEHGRADEQTDWHALSGQGLANAYGEDEPEYSLGLIKSPNPDYKP